MTIKLTKPNRLNKHKDKKSSGCGLCKPHKHGGRAMQDKKRLILKASQKVEVLEYDGRLHYIPIEPMKNLRGSLKGMDTTIQKDPDRL
jgi:hypothetical protein